MFSDELSVFMNVSKRHTAVCGGRSRSDPQSGHFSDLLSFQLHVGGKGQRWRSDLFSPLFSPLLLYCKMIQQTAAKNQSHTDLTFQCTLPSDRELSLHYILEKRLKFQVRKWLVCLCITLQTTDTILRCRARPVQRRG